MRRRLMIADPSRERPDALKVGPSESRGLARRKCEVIGQVVPAGSEKYVNLVNLSAISASLALSLALRAASSSSLNWRQAGYVGAAVSGTPSCQRPTILALIVAFASSCGTW